MTDSASEAGQPDQAVPEGAPRASDGCAAESVNANAVTADVAARARKQVAAQLSSPVLEAAARAQEAFNSPLLEAAARMQEAMNSPLLEVAARAQEEFSSPVLEAAARAQEAFNSPLLEAAARMQEAMNSPLLEAAARMQEAMNSPLLEVAARAQEEFSSPLLESVLPSLQAVAEHVSIRQSALDSLQEAANQSALRQMQAITPLLRDVFGRSMLDVVDETLRSLEDLAKEAYEEISAGDFSDEMIREIEDALSGFEPATQGLSPAVARQVWIVWVQSVVFTLCLYALITVPGAMTLGGLLGVGALAGVRRSGLLAAKVWDKHHSQSESDR
ncbi:hypothetical protein AB0899_06095 [Streptomyces sp. NPDC007002]|uniref:hypothetical protein n=1 Tax=Streptomyces sp. NPDC007002 TaxID=3156910 RepID=UPI003454930E